MPLSGCRCIAFVTPYNFNTWHMQLLVRGRRELIFIELVYLKQYHPPTIIMNNLKLTAWLQACQAVKEDNLNTDRSSLLFFFSEDLSNAAAPTKTPTDQLRWDTPSKSAKKIWPLPLMKQYSKFIALQFYFRLENQQKCTGLLIWMRNMSEHDKRK